MIALINKKKVDAMTAWDAFKKLAMKTIEVVELPRGLQAFRSTALGVITFSENRELAGKFIDFLVSDAGKKVYRELGWHHTA